MEINYDFLTKANHDEIVNYIFTNITKKPNNQIDIYDPSTVKIFLKIMLKNLKRNFFKRTTKQYRALIRNYRELEANYSYYRPTISFLKPFVIHGSFIKDYLNVDFNLEHLLINDQKSIKNFYMQLVNFHKFSTSEKEKIKENSKSEGIKEINKKEKEIIENSDMNEINHYCNLFSEIKIKNKQTIKKISEKEKQFTTYINVLEDTEKLKKSLIDNLKLEELNEKALENDLKIEAEICKNLNKQLIPENNIKLMCGHKIEQHDQLANEKKRFSELYSYYELKDFIENNLMQNIMFIKETYLNDFSHHDEILMIDLVQRIKNREEQINNFKIKQQKNIDTFNSDLERLNINKSHLESIIARINSEDIEFTEKKRIRVNQLEDFVLSIKSKENILEQYKIEIWEIYNTIKNNMKMSEEYFSTLLVQIYKIIEKYEDYQFNVKENIEKLNETN